MYEVEIKPHCDYEDFYTVAEAIEKIGLTFSCKLTGLDISYWDFGFQGNEVVLHYSIYSGITLFASNLLTESRKEEIGALANRLKALL